MPVGFLQGFLDSYRQAKQDQYNKALNAAQMITSQRELQDQEAQTKQEQANWEKTFQYTQQQNKLAAAQAAQFEKDKEQQNERTNQTRITVANMNNMARTTTENSRETATAALNQARMTQENKLAAMKDIQTEQLNGMPKGPAIINANKIYGTNIAVPTDPSEFNSVWHKVQAAMDLEQQKRIAAAEQLPFQEKKNALEILKLNQQIKEASIVNPILAQTLTAKLHALNALTIGRLKVMQSEVNKNNQMIEKAKSIVKPVAGLTPYQKSVRQREMARDAMTSYRQFESKIPTLEKDILNLRMNMQTQTDPTMIKNMQNTMDQMTSNLNDLKSTAQLLKPYALSNYLITNDKGAVSPVKTKTFQQTATKKPLLHDEIAPMPVRKIAPHKRTPKDLHDSWLNVR